MSHSLRVVVIGLGISGSSISLALARHGYSVTALDQFGPLHERGSSHGDTRIYRRAPFEGDLYVERAAMSLKGWTRWSIEAQEPLLVQCGGLDAGPADSPVVEMAEALCRRYELPYAILRGQDVNERFPHFKVPTAWRAVHQPLSGFVRPNATLSFLHRAARAAGATLLHDTRVLSIEPLAGSVRVQTAGGTVDSDILIVVVGSWLPKLFPEFDQYLRPERRVTAWFQPSKPGSLTNGCLPIFCFAADGGWYGTPTLDGRLKIGHDSHFGEQIDPDTLRQPPGKADADRLTPCIRQYFQGFSVYPQDMKPCISTMTANRHFIVDRHPQHDRILLFACCSGHGFKYAPEYGHIALDLVRGKSRPDIALWRLESHYGAAETPMRELRGLRS